MFTHLLNHKEFLIGLGRQWKKQTTEWSDVCGLVWPSELGDANTTHKKLIDDDIEPTFQGTEVRWNEEELLEESTEGLTELEEDFFYEKELIEDTDEVERLLGRLEAEDLKEEGDNFGSFFTTIAQAVGGA
jgi:hypothetical protein